MIERRRFFGLFGAAAASLAFKPVPERHLPSLAPPSDADRHRHLLEYFRYTDDQFKQCRLIVSTDLGFLWAPPITGVEREPGAIRLRVDEIPSSKFVTVDGACFQDVQGKTKLGLQSISRLVHLYPGDTLDLTYMLEATPLR